MAKAKIFVFGRKSAHDNRFPEGFFFRELGQFEEVEDAKNVLDTLAKGYKANERLEVREQDNDKNWVEVKRCAGDLPFQPELTTVTGHQAN